MLFKKFFQRIDNIEKKIDTLQTAIELINSVSDLKTPDDKGDKVDQVVESVDDAIDAYKRLRGL